MIDVMIAYKRLTLNSLPLKFSRLLSYLCCATLLLACSPKDQQSSLTGFTMGTTYSIQFIAQDIDENKLQTDIELRLEHINNLMSTYIPASELSRFNQINHSDWFDVNLELVSLVAHAQSISDTSNGAFDITVGPLVNLWGFGPHDAEFSLPSEQEIHISKQNVGYQNLQFRIDPPALKKTQTRLYVDLSAIAKGYAVDEIAKILDTFNIDHYMVEIGGEVKGKGLASHGEPWRIGIETPATQRGNIEAILSLENIGIATSGDYRNFVVHQGRTYSHTLDPRTGYPVDHSLASVTVLHESVATADAWATAFMVLGAEQAYEMAQKDQLAVLLITREDAGYKITASDKMKNYIK